MKCVPLSPHVGADVEDVDLARPLSSGDVAELRALWLRYVVLRFRGQRLSDDELMAWSARFGELEYAPMGRISERERQRRRNPYVTLISNIVEKGRPIGGLGALESRWHTDMAYVEEPATGSVLYAVAVPESGGNTQLTSMYAAYEALPGGLRERIAGLTLKHDASHDSVGGLRRGFEESTDPREAPGCTHPLVTVHPETGRRTLLLGRRQLAHVSGLSLDASEALLDELWSYAARPEHTWTQVWRVGDVLMWDNRAAMHRRDAFDPKSRRLMRRTQLKGTPPIAAA